MTENQSTLLPGFYGLYKVTWSNSSSGIFFLVMRNVFHTDLGVCEKFDLKVCQRIVVLVRLVSISGRVLPLPGMPNQGIQS